MFKSFLKDSKCFFCFFNRAHMIPDRVRNMAAPAILFHHAISIGLIDWSVPVSHARRCHASEKATVNSFSLFFNHKRIYKCLYDEWFGKKNKKTLATVKWGKKLHHSDVFFFEKFFLLSAVEILIKCNCRMQTRKGTGKHSRGGNMKELSGYSWQATQNPNCILKWTLCHANAVHSLSINKQRWSGWNSDTSHRSEFILAPDSQNNAFQHVHITVLYIQAIMKS